MRSLYDISKIYVWLNRGVLILSSSDHLHNWYRQLMWRLHSFVDILDLEKASTISNFISITGRLIGIGTMEMSHEENHLLQGGALFSCVIRVPVSGNYRRPLYSVPA